jgi:UDP-N-acetylglucosamine--N-acetylmuramyl-(pentapeptide) pyrophosphoryl-undecaprenol N-acetylglucosamine transferase
MLATAAALKVLDPTGEIDCVGTSRGLETELVPQAGYRLHLVDPIPLPRKLTGQLVSLPFRIIGSVRQAKAVLRQTEAEVVLGFGGYAALPVYLAARQLRLPVVIHEANAVPGLANRIAARFAKAVCVTFAATGFPRQIVTGMPMRAAIAGLDRSERRDQARLQFGLAPSDKVLLVSGGSLGARSLNTATIAALGAFDEAGISVLHVTGKANFDDPVQLPELHQARYIRVPYVEEMESAYAAADLMLARSGAATVSETALIGLPAIYVPLPHGNGEQAKNASAVVAAGAGQLIDDSELTGGRLAEMVTGLFGEPGELARMSQAARDLMPADAAQQVARQAWQLRRVP